ncbi:amidohydrolase family protein [uncultured Maritimibacter sp.]|jgi:alpha-D-ribose 1-methylphosphonate 5-triphosphate diphosphatase|uniref:amidohydrolase family protein n=1 Tax=uncultured Maritimibacter sp. TaxID=991866 RepID=UPI0026107A4B|nr:amidohydrolase family protein [uncultured Maritimibacter sp.]
MSFLPPLRLVGAQTLIGGALGASALGIAGGRIVDSSDPGLAEIDLSGLMVLPGIVDPHSTAITRHLAAVPGGKVPLDQAIATMDAEAVAHGVTTLWVAQGWSWAGGRLGPDQAEAMAKALDSHSGRADLRLQIIAETHLADCRERLIALVERHGIDSVIFSNAVPDAILAATAATHKLATWTEAQGIAMDDYLLRLRRAKDRTGEVPRRLLALAKAFDAMGVRYGSYDDADGETREQFRILGARIALCPVRAGAARVAFANGNPIVLDASDLARGATRAGAVSSQALLSKGLCDALASRDHPSSLAAAALALADSGQMSFAAAWSLISRAPARMMGLDDRGTLDIGKRADLVIFDPRSCRIEVTITQGRIAHMSGSSALRFLNAAPHLALAAE